MNTAAAIAQVVEDLRTAAGTPEAQLSEATGIPRATLQRRLKGSPFTVTELDAVATALDTDAAHIWVTAKRLS